MKYFVDCIDARYYHDQLDVVCVKDEFHFVFSQERKTGIGFHCVLVADEQSLRPYNAFRYPLNRRFAWLKESPTHAFYHEPETLQRMYRKIFTFHANILKCCENAVRLDYGTNWVSGGTPSEFISKEKMVSFVGSVEHPNSCGYEFRKRTFEHLRQRGGVDCFGKGIQWLDDKRAGLTPYRFSVAMENVCQDYYYTEKLIDCFLTDTVPIYWGCPAISEVFDPRGMLLFDNLNDLDRILDKCTIGCYQEMLPYVRENRKRVMENRLVNMTSIMERIADVLAPALEGCSPVQYWKRSGPLALARMVIEKSRMKWEER